MPKVSPQATGPIEADHQPRSGAGRRGLWPLARRRLRLFCVAALAATLLGGLLTPGAAAQRSALTLTMSVIKAEAKEGTYGSTEPAKVRLSLNRKLANGERLSIPLVLPSEAANDVLVNLHGTSRGVTLSGKTLVFEKGARRANLRVHALGDVTFDSFTVGVGEIDVSEAVSSKGGLTVNNPEVTILVIHLPAASIAPAAGGETITEGERAGFVISLDGDWRGPGKRPQITVDIDGSTKDGWLRLGMSRNLTPKDFTVRTKDDGIAAGDRGVTATLIRALGYWIDGDNRSAAVTVLDNGVPQTADPPQHDDPPPTPSQDPEPAQEGTDDQQDEDSPDPQTADDPPVASGQVLISHPQGDEEWLFPWESSTTGTPFNYCAELDDAPTATVTLTASASPDLATAEPLEFTADAWGRQCFEVHATAAAQNSTDELPRQVTLSHTASSDDARYDGIDVAGYTLYLGDDDPTSVTLGATDTTAAEGDDTAIARLTLTIGRALTESVLVPAVLNGEMLRYDEHIEVPLSFSGGKLDEDFRIELQGTPAGVTLNGNRVRFEGAKSGSATVAVIELSALDDDDGLDDSISVSIPSIGTNSDRVTTDDRFAHISHSVANNGGVNLAGSVTVTIDDDDPATTAPPTPPEAQFTEVWGGFHAEDSGTHNVTLELSEAQATDVTVSYSLTRSATLGSDYTIAGVTSSPASVTVPAGETSVTIGVQIIDDTVAERYESLDLRLIAGDGYTIGSRSLHAIVISDNDKVTTTPVSVNSYLVYVDEGDTAEVVVALGLPLGIAVTIPLVVTSLTAESGDHGTVSSVTIPAGKTAVVAVISTTADADGDDETFSVSLGSPLPSLVTAGSSSSTTIRIRDNS